MNVLLDFILPNSERLEGVYFIQYQIPIRAGIGSRILRYANDSLKCFKGNDEVTVDLQIDELELVRAYDEETGEDVTEQFVQAANTIASLSSPFSMSNRSPLAREVVVLD